MNQENDYRISFFKPTTARAKVNRNIVLWLISIWALAVFGFHFLLRAIEKPTPEPELVEFREVWGAIETGDASIDELKKFVLSTLHVAGKVFIAPNHRAALDDGITWALWQIATSPQQTALSEALYEFKEAEKNAKLVTDEGYVQAKRKLQSLVVSILEINPDLAVAQILPLELTLDGMDSFNEKNKEIIEEAMPLYTIHNRSVLTDTIFLGFPFHYFYTAVLLLIIFIGICWIYCYKIDKYNKRIELSE